MTNSAKQQIEILGMLQTIRDEMMAMLTDADLAFSLGGNSLTLGALCRQMGEIEYMYIQSFKSFKLDWSYRNPDAVLETSVSTLTTWLKALDHDLNATLEGLSEESLDKLIDRGGFQPPARMQIDIYMQALFIFYGKASIYLQALKKPLTDMWKTWIG